MDKRMRFSIARYLFFESQRVLLLNIISLVDIPSRDWMVKYIRLCFIFIRFPVHSPAGSWRYLGFECDTGLGYADYNMAENHRWGIMIGNHFSRLRQRTIVSFGNSSHQLGLELSFGFGPDLRLEFPFTLLLFARSSNNKSFDLCDRTPILTCQRLDVGQLGSVVILT
jgi:hypothetical protein